MLSYDEAVELVPFVDNGRGIEVETFEVVLLVSLSSWLVGLYASCLHLGWLVVDVGSWLDRHFR